MMKSRMKRVFYIAASIMTAVALVMLFWFLLSGKDIAVLNPSGEVAIEQQKILLFALGLSALVVLPVFTMLVLFSIKYRASNKKAEYKPEWGESRVLEGLWWGIPIFIIGILGVLTYQTSHSLDPYKQLSGGEPLEVQVVALRWKWLFIYPEQQVATLNYLPLPVDKPVKFSLAADAPMSAFWIPSLGSQIYAMNGMKSELNLKATKMGEYMGYTTNINGEGYAKMTFKARVSDQAGFDAWSLRASRSSESMNAATYSTLETPESMTEERTYKLSDPELFDAVVKKYGHSHGSHMEHES